MELFSHQAVPHKYFHFIGITVLYWIEIFNDPSIKSNTVTRKSSIFMQEDSIAITSSLLIIDLESLFCETGVYQ